MPYSNNLYIYICVIRSHFGSMSFSDWGDLAAFAAPADVSPLEGGFVGGAPASAVATDWGDLHVAHSTSEGAVPVEDLDNEFLTPLGLESGLALRSASPWGDLAVVGVQPQPVSLDEPCPEASVEPLLREPAPARRGRGRPRKTPPPPLAAPEAPAQNALVVSCGAEALESALTIAVNAPLPNRQEQKRLQQLAIVPGNAAGERHVVAQRLGGVMLAHPLVDKVLHASVLGRCEDIKKDIPVRDYIRDRLEIGTRRIMSKALQLEEAEWTVTKHTRVSNLLGAVLSLLQESVQWKTDAFAVSIADPGGCNCYYEFAALDETSMLTRQRTQLQRGRVRMVNSIEDEQANPTLAVAKVTPKCQELAIRVADLTARTKILQNHLAYESLISCKGQLVLFCHNIAPPLQSIETTSAACTSLAEIRTSKVSPWARRFDCCARFSISDAAPSFKKSEQ